jgi:cysteinyl-tRNA synthetase
MSKSAGGFTTLRDLVGSGHDPLAVRYFLMANAHYRSKLKLSGEALHAAGEQVRRLRDFADRVRRSTPHEVDDSVFSHRVDDAAARYREAVDDDLNLPQGLGMVFDLVREANAAMDANDVGEEGRARLLALIELVDAHLDVMSAQEPGLEQEIERLIGEREAARKAKDFKRSDSIREELRAKGIVLEDGKDGVRWRREAP